MAKSTERLFVLTGGPGSGKSTLIEDLAQPCRVRRSGPGHHPGPGRDRRTGAALARSPCLRRADAVLGDASHHVAQEHMAQGVVFFDRGVPDVVGYLRLLGLPVPARMDHAARIFRYNRRVFIAPPWPEIFRGDRERKQTFDEAVRTCEAMVSTYTDYGYELVELPRTTVERRVRFVVAHAGIRPER